MVKTYSQSEHVSKMEEKCTIETYFLRIFHPKVHNPVVETVIKVLTPGDVYIHPGICLLLVYASRIDYSL